MHKHNTLDKVFHALSDSSRRKMLNTLSHGKLCSASELGSPLNISQPAASKHIKVLEDSGLVVRTIEGRTHFFALNKTPLDEAESWIAAHKTFWSSALEQLESLAQSVENDSKK